MSETKWNFSISKAIGLIADPIILALKLLTHKLSDIYTHKELTITGDAVGGGTIIGDGAKDPVYIQVTIDPIKHTHAANTLPASVAASPNTIVQRDNQGRIYSSGNMKINTGYKIANGTDIGTFYRPKDMTTDLPIDVKTIVLGNGSAVINAELTVTDDHKITLYITTKDF